MGSGSTLKDLSDNPGSMQIFILERVTPGSDDPSNIAFECRIEYSSQVVYIVLKIQLKFFGASFFEKNIPKYRN